MKGSTTQRKPSTTPTTNSSIAAYSATRSKSNEVYEDYSEVRFCTLLLLLLFFKLLFNKKQQFVSDYSLS